MSFELNHGEYGLSAEGTMPKTIDFHFNPSEYGILNDYSVVKEIYRVMLSPTIITLTTHKETNMVRIEINWSDSCFVWSSILLIVTFCNLSEIYASSPFNHSNNSFDIESNKKNNIKR